LFQEFQQLVKASFERLDHGLVILKQCIPPSELALAKLREKLEQDLIIFREELNKKFAHIDAQLAEIRVRQAEIKKEQDENKKILEIVLKRMSTLAVSEEETVDPTTKTNVPFFRR
jgi:hypothetical protein